MPRTTSTSQQPRQPKLRRHKRKGRADQAFVVINGTPRYLGRWGSDDARAAYDRLIAEWLANGRSLPAAPDEITVIEVAAAFVKANPKAAQRHATQRALEALKNLYGELTATDFGPKNVYENPVTAVVADEA